MRLRKPRRVTLETLPQLPPPAVLTTEDIRAAVAKLEAAQGSQPERLTLLLGRNVQARLEELGIGPDALRQ